MPWRVLQAADAPRAGTAGSDAVFKALDTDGNGLLSRQEFQAGYAALRRAITVEARLHEQFRAVDADHDGSIDAGEYARLVLVVRLGKAAPPLSMFDVDRDQKLGFAEYVAAVRHLAALQPQPTTKIQSRSQPAGRDAPSVPGSLRGH
jgi:hypothetical protein